MAPSNSELAQLSALRPWERRLLEVRAVGATAVGVVTLSVLVVIGALPTLVEVGAALFCGVMLYARLGRIARRRSAPHYTELVRRLGQAPFDVYLAEAQEKLRSDTELQRVLLFQGGDLPRGDVYWIRIRVPKTSDVRATVDATIGPSLWRRGAAPGVLGEFDIISAHVSEAQQTNLSSLLAMNGTLQTLPPQVIDGFPCRVAVVDHEGVMTGDANLAGLPAEARTQLTVRLMNGLLEVVRPLARREAIIGWCDATGNVGVERQ